MLDPKNALRFLDRIHTYVRMKKFENALEDANKFVQLEPTNGNFYKPLTLIHILMGRESKAKATIKLANSNFLNDFDKASSMENLGILLFETTKLAKSTGPHNRGNEHECHFNLEHGYAGDRRK